LGNLSTPKSVQKLQTALHAKAKAEAGYRFYALYDKISREDILAHAYAQCRSNKGAPGVDNHALEMAPSDWPTDKLERLERLLAQATPSVEPVVSLIAHLLEIPTEKRHPPLDLGPEQMRERLQTYLMEVVAGLGAPHPWLIVVEDLQWIDPSSEELLDPLVQQALRLPGLLILTFRPEYAARWIDIRAA